MRKLDVYSYIYVCVCVCVCMTEYIFFNHQEDEAQI